MQNRTDMVGVSPADKLKQLFRNNRRWLTLAGYVLSGYVMANSFLFGGVAPFGVAWCAALPKKHAPCAALGAVVGYLLTSAHLSSIKYIAAIVLTLLVKWFLSQKIEQRSAPVWAVATASLSLLAACAIYLLAAGYSLYDLILAAAEVLLAGGAAYFFARSLAALDLGVSGLGRSDISCLIISLAVVVMGFEGLRIGGLSAGRILSIFLILLAARYGREAGGAIAGITAGIAMGFSGGDYTYVICAYALGGLVAGVFGHMGRVAAVTSFIVMNALSALLLPTYVDLFSALMEMFVASAVFIALPPVLIKKMRLGSLLQPAATDASPQVALRDRLEGISEALLDISTTTHQVSDQLGKLEGSGLEGVYSKTIDRVCFRCGMKTSCWQERYGDSMNAVNDCMRILKRDGSINRELVPKHFTQTCCKLDDFLTELNTQFHGHVSREGVQLKVSRVRSVVTDQFEGLSMMMDEIADELCGIHLLEPQRTRRVRDYFDKEKIEIRDLLCYSDEFDRLTVEATLPGYQMGRLNKTKATLDLCALLEAEFDLPQVVVRKKLAVITFTEKATFTVDLGAYQIASGGNRLCGDAYEYIRNQSGMAHFILSDGMGSGGNAAVDSAMASGLIARLISVGVSHEAALKMVNSALLIKSGEESLATIDICSVDLFTGKADFYKAGAAPTFLLRDGRAGYVESTSLPAGILRGVAFEKSSLTLHEGDIVVMASDGVIATGVEWVKSELETLRAQDMQRLCEKLATTAKLRRTDQREDDITVLAICLKKGI